MPRLTDIYDTPPMLFLGGYPCCCSGGTCDLFEVDPKIPILAQGFTTDYVGGYPLSTREHGQWIHDTTANDVEYIAASALGFDLAGFAASDNASGNGAGNVWIWRNDHTAGTRPSASTATGTATENGGTINIDLAALTNDTTTCVVATTPVKGSAVVTSGFTLEYTPTAGKNGKDFFFYRAQSTNGYAYGRVEIDITVVSSPMTDSFQIVDYYIACDDDDGFVLTEAELLGAVFGTTPFTFTEIRCPVSDSLWIPAGKYLQANATLPSTGVSIAIASEPFPVGSGYYKVNDDIQLLIVDGGTPVAKLERVDDITLEITTDLGTQVLEATTPSAGTLSPISMFHKLVYTQTAVQSSRDNSKDADSIISAEFDDGTTRSRHVDSSFSLSHRASDTGIPSGSKARVYNGNGSNQLIGKFIGDKVIDYIAPANAICPDERTVCTVVNDNHVQQWTSTITHSAANLDAPDIRYSTNCSYTEIGSSYGGQPYSTGELRQEYLRDRYSYNDCFFGLAGGDDWSKIGAYTITEPTINPPTAYYGHLLTVVPTDIGGGMTRLTITLSFFALGVTWNGSLLNGQSPGSNYDVFQDTDDLTVTINQSLTGSIGGLLSSFGSTTFGTGPDPIGWAYNEGDTVYRTMSFSSHEILSWEFTQILILAIGGFDVQIIWEEDVADWSDTSPNLTLSGADAISISGDATGTNFFLYTGHSTIDNGVTMPNGTESFTPHLGGPTTTVCDTIAGTAQGPVSTGDFDAEYDIDTVAEYSKPDWTTLSLTLTGGT